MKLVFKTLSLLLLLATMTGCGTISRPTDQSTPPQPTADVASFKGNLGKAEKGDAEAQYCIGKFYAEGRGVDQDRAEAVTWFRKAAEQGNPAAQVSLGHAMLLGQGVKADRDEAAKWFRKAADQRNADAQVYLLGIAWFEALGESKDCAKAREAIRKLAQQGNSVAENFLGVIYFHGGGIQRDGVEAVNWFRKAAEQGNADAQANLGEACLYGKGVKTNYAEAIKWFLEAAKQGNAHAQVNLGVCYRTGKGVHKNPVESVTWFRKAAQQGVSEAQASVGMAYRRGAGVAQDYVQAYKWFDRAADQGDSDAVSACEEISRLMTSEQLAAAGAVPRRHLTQFDRRVIDGHEQRYDMSCIPSSVEMVLKLLGRVPASYYDLQTAWKNKADGSFRDFDGKMFAGVTFHLHFMMARNSDFPLTKLFDKIDSELKAGRFVIVGLACTGGWHDWVIYDEDANGEFLAISKGGGRTIDNRHVKKAITDMQGTDIGTYELKL
jgi:TPR repeat protein